MPQIVLVPRSTDGEPRTPVAAERLVRGAPWQAAANAWSDPSERFHCGVWEGDVGAWRVRYTEHEFCHILSGRVRMIGDDGSVTEVVAGDSFVIPAGFEGVWEVLEPTRKLYAVYEPAP